MTTATIDGSDRTDGRDARAHAHSMGALVQVLKERQAQVRRFGEQRRDDIRPIGTVKSSRDPGAYACRSYFIPTPQEARERCREVEQERRRGADWSSILLEEFCEVVEAAYIGDPDRLEEELIQTAAVCIAWVEDIRSRPKDGPVVVPVETE